MPIGINFQFDSPGAKRRRQLEEEQTRRQLEVSEGNLNLSRIQAADSYIRSFPQGTFTLQEQNKIRQDYMAGKFEVPTERPVAGIPGAVAGTEGPGGELVTSGQRFEPITIPQTSPGFGVLTEEGEAKFVPIEGVDKSQVVGTYRLQAEKPKKEKPAFTFDPNTGKVLPLTHEGKQLDTASSQIIRLPQTPAKQNARPTDADKRRDQKRSQFMGIIRSRRYMGKGGPKAIEDQEQAVALATSRDFGLDPYQDKELFELIKQLPAKEGGWFGGEGFSIDQNMPAQMPQQPAQAEAQSQPPAQPTQAVSPVPEIGGGKTYATEDEMWKAYDKGLVKVGDIVNVAGKQFKLGL